MLPEFTQQIIAEKKIANPKILYDIDGPGTMNNAVTEKEERPVEGGILLYPYYYKYPYKGLPDKDAVERLHQLKKFGMLAMGSIKKRGTKIGIALLFVLPRPISKYFIEPVIDSLMAILHWNLYYQWTKTEKYCTCIREVHRSFTKVSNKTQDLLYKKVINLVRDFVCVVLELDSAYRFRFQDIIVEAKLEELRAGDKRQIAEIERLFDLMISREKLQPAWGKEIYTDIMPAKWRQIKRYFLQALKYIKPARTMIVDFFKEVDIEKIKPDEGDNYYNYLRIDYDFGGKKYPERMEIRKAIEGENWKYFEVVANGFLAYSNKMEVATRQK